MAWGSMFFILCLSPVPVQCGSSLKRRAEHNTIMLYTRDEGPAVAAVAVLECRACAAKHYPSYW